MAFFHWKGISIAEIAIYSFILVIAIPPAYKLIVTPRSRFKWPFIRFFLLVAIKIAAGALAYQFIKDANNGNINENILISALVLNSIIMGFIMMMMIQVVLYLGYHLDPEMKRKKITLISVIRNRQIFNLTIEEIDQLLERLTLIGIILVAVGAGISSGGTTSTTKGLMLAGTIIFLVVLIAVMICSGIKLHRHHVLRRAIHKGNYSLILASTLIMLPFLVVRAIYSICYVASIKTGSNGYINSSKFVFLFGDWKIYAFMAFLEEVICVALLSFIIYVIWTTEKQFLSGANPDQEGEFESSNSKYKEEYDLNDTIDARVNKS